MISVFEYNDYKSFLGATEEHRATFQRGFRSRLAEALGCQNAYISHVLNDGAHFSLEQGLNVCQFLGLNETEKKYFLLLIEIARAGSEGLKNYFLKELSALRDINLSIKNRIPHAQNLTPEAQVIYYSHWMYAAIHMLTTLKTHQTLEAIVETLKLPEEAIQSAVIFLISTGLLAEKNNKITPGLTQIHLSKDSPLTRQHHTNWRLAAVESLAQIEKNDIHYSTVSTLSNSDVDKLKAQLVTVIQNYVETVRDSKEETMFGFNLDFYSLIKK